MRHLVHKKKFNRDTNHRRSLLKNLMGQLLEHEKVTTTEAKAKVIKAMVEKMIYKAKRDTLAMRRQVMAVLDNDTTIKKLFRDIAPRFGDKTGGFINSVRIGRRKGDNTVMVQMTITKAAQVEPVAAATK